MRKHTKIDRETTKYSLPWQCRLWIHSSTPTARAWESSRMASFTNFFFKLCQKYRCKIVVELEFIEISINFKSYYELTSRGHERSTHHTYIKYMKKWKYVWKYDSQQDIGAKGILTIQDYSQIMQKTVKRVNNTYKWCQ